jgi:tRNA nucleotidyltransferase (CCA-adding enzyme)
MRLKLSKITESIASVYQNKVAATVIKATQDRISQDSLKLITNISEDQRTHIMDLLKDGEEKGRSIAATASTLLTTGLDKGIFKSARRRAYLIARTELHRSRQMAAVDIFKAADITTLKWVVVEDSRLCKPCKAREKTYNIKSIEDNLPPEHPRCRCRVLPADYQMSIKVKKDKKDKVVETKVSPTPKDYLYVVKLGKAFERNVLSSTAVEGVHLTSEDLEKARQHKYLKRTGIPGKYEYTYREGKMDRAEHLPALETHVTLDDFKFGSEAAYSATTEAARILFHEHAQHLHLEEVPDDRTLWQKVKAIIKEKVSIRHQYKKLVQLGKEQGPYFVAYAIAVEILEQIVIPAVLVYMGKPHFAPMMMAIHTEPVMYPLFFGIRKLMKKKTGLKKAMPHKYIKRIGAPGKYQYFYEEPELQSGIKTVGIGIDKQFKQKGFIDLRGQKVNSVNDVAELSQIYRNPQYETFRYVYVRNGVVVGHEGRSSRIPGQSGAFAKDRVKEIFGLKSRISRLGADTVWLVHNHPTGNPTPSGDDLRLTNSLMKEIPEIKGHIIVNSQTFGFIEHQPFGKFDRIQNLAVESSIKMLPFLPKPKAIVPILNSPLLGKVVKNMQDVAAVATALKVPKTFATILYRAGTEIKAIQEIPLKMLTHYNATLDYLRGRAREFGARDIILALEEGSPYKDADRTLETLVGESQILDAIYYDHHGKPLQSLREGLPLEEDRENWMGRPVKTFVTKSLEKGEFASTQVNLPKPLAARVLDIVKLIDPKDLHPTEKQDDDVHITVRYGLKPEVPLEDVKAVLNHAGKVQVTVLGVDVFQPKDKDYDVLVLRVDSPELARLNEKLKQLPHEDTFPFYQPHSTIAYLKRDCGHKYENLVTGLEGEMVEFDTVKFSDVEHNKKNIDLEKAEDFYHRTRFGKQELVRKPRKYRVTFADGSKAIVNARHSREAVLEGNKLSKFTVQRVEDLEKARSHKYIKRTGMPGKYQYFYDEPVINVLGTPLPSVSTTLENKYNLKQFINLSKDYSRDEIKAYVSKEIETIREKIGFDGHQKLHIIVEDDIAINEGAKALYGSDDITIKIDKKYENTLAHEYAHFIFDQQLIPGSNDPTKWRETREQMWTFNNKCRNIMSTSLDEMVVRKETEQEVKVIGIGGVEQTGIKGFNKTVQYEYKPKNLEIFFDKMDRELMQTAYTLNPRMVALRDLFNDLGKLYSNSDAPDITSNSDYSIRKNLLYFLEPTEMFARAVDTYVQGEPGVASVGEFIGNYEDDRNRRSLQDKYYDVVKKWGDKYLKTGIIKSLLEKAKSYTRFRHGKHEQVKGYQGKPRLHDLTPLDRISRYLTDPTRPEVVKALDVVKNVHDVGGRALLVGGCIRDALLGKHSKDVDIEVYGVNPDELATLLQSHGKVDQVGRSFGVFKVSDPGLEEAIDVSLPRRDSKVGKGHKKGIIGTPDPTMSIKEAASRRDLTINSLAFDPITKELFDPFNGTQDVKDKVLRATNPETFGEDSLRVLRVMRFAAQLGFSPDVKLAWICNQIDLTDLPKERIFGELSGTLLKSKHPSIGLMLIPILGIGKILPELVDLKGVEQEPDWHPEGDAWTHTLEVVDEAAKMRDRLPDPKERLIFMLGALCHDLGKPETTEVKDGKIISHSHDSVGADITTKFLERLTDETYIVEKVVSLVQHHMKPTFFFHDKVNNSAIRRLAKKVDIPMLVMVSAADKSGRGEKKVDLTAERWMMKKFKELGLEHPEALDPKVKGRDLIPLGIEPGPEMGRLLDKIYNAQLEGLFTTVGEGLEYAKKQGWLLTTLSKSVNLTIGAGEARSIIRRLHKSRERIIPYNDRGESIWAKTVDNGFVLQRPAAKGDDVLIKGLIATVVAVGKDGVIAKDGTGTKYQILNKDIQIFVEKRV